MHIHATHIYIHITHTYTLYTCTHTYIHYTCIYIIHTLHTYTHYTHKHIHMHTHAYTLHTHIHTLHIHIHTGNKRIISLFSTNFSLPVSRRVLVFQVSFLEQQNHLELPVWDPRNPPRPTESEASSRVPISSLYYDGC